MGAKRAKLEGVAMVDFIIAELDKASKLDADTKSTLEGFKGSAPAAAAPVAAAPVAAAPVAAAPIDFNIKSIDFIKDKEVRGTAKKAFMGAKRAKLEGVAMVDFIIAELDKASKLDADTKSTLEGFKEGKNLMTIPIPELSVILFFGICGLIIASALLVVTSPNLVHSAVSLLFTFFGVAAIYIFLYADFIAATQVIIYVGGILVLIIFGVMLTNKIENATIDSKTHNQIPGIVFTLSMLAMQFYIILNTNWKIVESDARETTVKEIGNLLLGKYLLPFEVISVLLLASLIGAAMLSRRKTEK